MSSNAKATESDHKVLIPVLNRNALCMRIKQFHSVTFPEMGKLNLIIFHQLHY